MSSDTEDLAARLARIKRLTDEYQIVKAQSADARKLAERIRREVQLATKQIRGHTRKRR